MKTLIFPEGIVVFPEGSIDLDKPISLECCLDLREELKEAIKFFECLDKAAQQKSKDLTNT